MPRCGAISRRAFYPLLASFATGVLARPAQIRIGLQLYSIRGQCEQDLPAALRDVASAGYAGVEFAGYYGHGAAELTSLLAKSRLRCCGAHVSISELLGNRLTATIDFHQVLGNRTLIVPGLPESFVSSRAAWLKTAELFSNLSARLNTEGIKLGYHNHAAEFQTLEDERPWDTFFRHVPPTVVMELDVGNAGMAGADPMAEIQRYPGRAKSLHLKDFTPGRADLLIGEGDVDWIRLLRTAHIYGGTKWFIIEHETRPSTYLSEISVSLRRLRSFSAAALR